MRTAATPNTIPAAAVTGNGRSPAVGSLPLVRWLSLLALAATVFLSRLPLIQDPIDIRPDGAEYLSIARHLAQSGEWVSTLKWHFSSETDVRHFALADRPPLYPLVLSAAIGSARTPEAQIYAARILNCALAALAAVMAWLLFAAEFGPLTAWLSVLLFSLLPQNLRYGAQPLTEMLFLVLLLAALAAWRWAGQGAPAGLARGMRSSAAGALMGLAYLTHGAGLVPFVALCAAALLPDGRTPLLRRLPAAVWLIGGFIAVAAFYWAPVAGEYGSPFHTALELNFRVAHIHEAIYQGFERDLPTPAAFIAGDPGRAAGLIMRQAWTVWTTLLDPLLYLLPLLLLARRSDICGARGLYVAIALLLALAHSLAWVTWGAARYLLPAYLLLLPVLISIAVSRLREVAAPPVWKGVLAASLMVALAAAQSLSPAAPVEVGPNLPRWPWLLLPAASAALLLFNAARRRHTVPARFISGLLACSVGFTAAAAGRLTCRLYLEKARPDRGYPDTALKRAAVEWVRGNTYEATTIASNEPWVINALTWRSAITLPWLRNRGQTSRFLHRYHPDAVVLLVSRGPGEPPAEEALARLLAGPEAREGLTIDWVGGYSVHSLTVRVFRPGPRPGQKMLILSTREKR